MNQMPYSEDEFEFEDSPSVRALLAYLAPSRPAVHMLIYPEPNRDSPVYEAFLRGAHKPPMWQYVFTEPESPP